MTRHAFTRTLIALSVPIQILVSATVAMAEQGNAGAPDVATTRVERKFVLGLGSSIRVPIAHQEPFNEHVFLRVA